MPIDGCPESRLKGWELGYIDITWRDPYSVYETNDSTVDANNYDDVMEQLRDVTRTQLPNIQSVVIGPYSRHRIKLNFCYKITRNISLDTGSWPPGNYSIYGDDIGCPLGKYSF